MKHLLAASVASLAISCTPSQLSTAEAIVRDVASAAPVICAVLSVAGQPGSACGAVASDVSDVARLVQTILDGLPRGRTVYSGPAGIVYRGVTISLPSAYVPEVQARLGARR